MKVINLFAGPGAGKSTTAAALFVHMKQAGLKVELVTEFAKTLTYEENSITLDNQLAVLGEQDRRLRCLDGKVDYAITDSPLLLALAYARGPFADDWFYDTVLGAFGCYENALFYLRRVKPYQQYGRSQTEEEALRLDKEIALMLHRTGWAGRTRTLDGDTEAALRIYDTVVVSNE